MVVRATDVVAETEGTIRSDSVVILDDDVLAWDCMFEDSGFNYFVFLIICIFL